MYLMFVKQTLVLLTNWNYAINITPAIVALSCACNFSIVTYFNTLD